MELAGMPCHDAAQLHRETSFEIHHSGSVRRAWRGPLAAGEDMGIRPHGLQALFRAAPREGARIIGMDTELDTTPRRLGMDWAVNMTSPISTVAMRWPA
jgi:sarcosine oxidase subunit alpha